LKDIVRIFGEEVVLIWVALMTKKRIVVYADKLPVLLKVIRGFPVLVWHRQNWNILRPFVTSTPQEIAELTSSGVYCAGFFDPSIRSQESLYDLFVDVNSRTITVAAHAQDDFVLGSVHQDIANFLTANANEETTDQALIKGLAGKTKDLLTKLEGLRVEDPEDKKLYITTEILEQRKLPPSTVRFLYNVANAEGYTKGGMAK